MPNRSVGPTPTNRVAENRKNAWTQSMTSFSRVQESASTPTATQIPEGEWGVWKNTTSGTIALFVNDNGTIKSVALTT